MLVPRALQVRNRSPLARRELPLDQPVVL